MIRRVRDIVGRWGEEERSKKGGVGWDFDRRQTDMGISNPLCTVMTIHEQ